MTVDAMPNQAAGRTKWRMTFHFGMALWLAFAVLFGFGQEVDGYFIHPTQHRPTILFVHSALASAWLALYVVQTGLIAGRNRALHRRLGLFGLALGVALIAVSVPTALVMNGYDVSIGLNPNYSFLGIPLFDMVLFTGFFAVAALRRHRADWHRRAMFLAMLTMADAGFGRWPRSFASPAMMSVVLWLTGAVALIHDWRTTGRIHRVYAVGLPALIASNIAASALFITHPAWWDATARSLTMLVWR